MNNKKQDAEFPQRIANVLVRLRTELCLSQEEVAKRLRMARTTVSHLENGKHEYHYALLRAVARVFELDVFRLALMVEAPDAIDDPIVAEAAEKISARLVQLQKSSKQRTK